MTDANGIEGVDKKSFKDFLATYPEYKVSLIKLANYCYSFAETNKLPINRNCTSFLIDVLDFRACDDDEIRQTYFYLTGESKYKPAPVSRKTSNTQAPATFIEELLAEMGKKFAGKRLLEKISQDSEGFDQDAKDELCYLFAIDTNFMRQENAENTPLEVMTDIIKEAVLFAMLDPQSINFEGSSESMSPEQIYACLALDMAHAVKWQIIDGVINIHNYATRKANLILECITPFSIGSAGRPRNYRSGYRNS